MRNSTLDKRHYATGAALLLLVTFLGLVYLRLVAEQWLPDMRPWLLGQGVFQADQSSPVSPDLLSQLPVSTPIMDVPIAAGASRDRSESADPQSAAQLERDDIGREDIELRQVRPAAQDLAGSEVAVERQPNSEFLSKTTRSAESEIAFQTEPSDFDIEERLASTPGVQGEGRQVPRLDLDLPPSMLEELVQSGHLLLIVRALDPRLRARFLRAEPIENGFRLHPLSDSELGKISSRHIGYGRNGLVRKVLADTSGTLRSMKLDSPELTVRFTAETDLQLQNRQLEALARAGMTEALHSGEVVSTRGSLVHCGGALGLQVVQVSSGAQTVVFDDPRTRC